MHKKNSPDGVLEKLYERVEQQRNTAQETVQVQSQKSSSITSPKSQSLKGAKAFDVSYSK